MSRKPKTVAAVVVLFLGVIIVLFPLVWMISTSLKPLSDAFSGGLIPSHPTLSNYESIFSASSGAPVLRWLSNSLGVSISASVLVMIIDSMAAFALARLRFACRRIILNMAIASLVIPFIAVLIPLYLEFESMNMLNTYWVLILPYTAHAFGVFLLYQFFSQIPKEFEEAAIIDGANKFQMWLRIFVPLSLPASATLGLLTFMNVYNDFFWPLVSTSSNNMRTMTVGIQIMAIGQYTSNAPLLMALTFISVIPMVIAFLIAQKQLTQGVAMTGINF